MKPKKGINSMTEEYKIIGDKVLVTDGSGEQERKNVDNIDEILRRENYIEYIEKILRESKAKLGEIRTMSNRTVVLHTLFKVLFGVGATAIIAFIINFLQFKGANPLAETLFGPITTRLFVVLGAEAIMSPAFGFYIHLCWKNHKNSLEEQAKYSKVIKYLEKKLEDEKRELCEVKETSQISNNTRTASLSLKAYNEQMQSLLKRQLVTVSYSSGACLEGYQENTLCDVSVESHSPFIMRPKKKNMKKEGKKL